MTRIRVFVDYWNFQLGLNQKGRKVVQAGFPPAGVDLATSCWASFDVFADREDVRRSDNT